MIDESPSSIKPQDPKLRKEKGSHQISLRTIMILFTYAAIFGAIIQLSLRETKVVPWLMYEDCFALAVFAGIAGTFIGLFMERRYQSAIVGSIVGAFIGGMAGALGAIHGDQSLRVNQIAFIGSFLMVVTILVWSRSSTKIDGSKAAR